MDPTELTPEERERWEQLDDAQRALVRQRAPLWRRAYEICSLHPGADVGDVYHVLATWHETPTQRLQRALQRGRAVAGSR